MWANTAPDGGIVLLGVDDDGAISGCSSVELEHLNHLERAGDVYCPDARHECKHVNVRNKHGQDDYIIAILVRYRPDRLVETSGGEAFVRAGSSKKRLTDDEKREVKAAKGQIDVEAEPSTLSFPKDFDLLKVQQFVDAVRAARGIPEDRTVPEVLELRRLGKRLGDQFIPNLACVLLFAKDPQSVVPGCKIRFLRFEGTEEKTGQAYNVIKSSWIEGAIPTLIQDAALIVGAQIREFVRLGANKQFYSVPEYPAEAFYETVVNACVHRSYNLRTMHISIKMFDDRIEVESPGGFPPLVTPENIYDMHVPRNPHLMDALFYLNFVQCAHEGTRRIRDAMRDLGLPEPKWKQTEVNASLVRVTLSNDVEHRRAFVDTDAYLALGKAVSDSLDENDRRIVNHIAEHEKINVTEASRILGMRWQSAKRRLAKLVERNILDHVHSSTVERDAAAYFTLKKRLSDKIRGGSGGSSGK